MHKIIERLPIVFFFLFFVNMQFCLYRHFFLLTFSLSLCFSPRNVVYHYIFIPSFIPRFRYRRSERYVRMHMALVASQLIKFPSFLRVDVGTTGNSLFVPWTSVPHFRNSAIAMFLAHESFPGSNGIMIQELSSLAAFRRIVNALCEFSF